MAFLCPVRLNRSKSSSTGKIGAENQKKKNYNSKDGVLIGGNEFNILDVDGRELFGQDNQQTPGRITGSSSIETLIRVGLEKENGVSSDSRVICLHDFEPCVDDELSVKKGEIVNILYRENDWVYVVKTSEEHSGEGFIPHSYCAPYTTSLLKYLASTTTTTTSNTTSTSGKIKQKDEVPAESTKNAQKTSNNNKGEPITTSTCTVTGEKESSEGKQRRNSNKNGNKFQQQQQSQRRSNKLEEQSRLRDNDKDFGSIDGSIEDGWLNNLQHNEFTTPFYKDQMGHRYIVLYKFNGRDENDVSVERGELVTVLNNEDPEWYWIVRSDGLEGFIPAAFVFPLNTLIMSNNTNLQTDSNSIFNNSNNNNTLTNTGNTHTSTISQVNNSTPYTGTGTGSVCGTGRRNSKSNNTSGGIVAKNSHLFEKNSTPSSLWNSNHSKGLNLNVSSSTSPVNNYHNDPAAVVPSPTSWSESNVNSKQNGQQMLSPSASSSSSTAPPLKQIPLTSTTDESSCWKSSDGGNDGNGKTEEKNELHSQNSMNIGTELVMLYDYKAQAPDDLSMKRGDWIYADLNHQTVEGWIWAFAPKQRKYGFIPKAYARPPAMTSL